MNFEERNPTLGSPDGEGKAPKRSESGVLRDFIPPELRDGHLLEALSEKVKEASELLLKNGHQLPDTDEVINLLGKAVGSGMVITAGPEIADFLRKIVDGKYSRDFENVPIDELLSAFSEDETAEELAVKGRNILEAARLFVDSPVVLVRSESDRSALSFEELMAQADEEERKSREAEAGNS